MDSELLVVSAMARSFLDTGLRGSLVVDDEPGVLKATQILLEVDGYRVCTAKSMADAVAVARTRQDIEVLVTDYHLAKDELGTSVIAAVREVLGDHLGCILISGDTSSAMKRLIRDDRTRIASKPVDADELLAVLKSLAAPAITAHDSEHSATGDSS